MPFKFPFSGVDKFASCSSNTNSYIYKLSYAFRFAALIERKNTAFGHTFVIQPLQIFEKQRSSPNN